MTALSNLKFSPPFIKGHWVEEHASTSLNLLALSVESVERFELVQALSEPFRARGAGTGGAEGAAAPPVFFCGQL